MTNQTLFSLPVGAGGTVGAVGLSGVMRRRLLDLGLVPGACVRCLYAAPSGNPRAYLVRGTVIALRNQDARGVALRQLWA